MKPKNLIINFVPTGMIPSKLQNPKVPISPQEIIEDVHRAYEKGITLVHLHARDETGIPTYKSAVYREIVEGVKKYCNDLVICLSLSGRNFNELDKRSEALELGVDMGSLTLSSLNFPQQASVNSPEMIFGLCERMKETGTNPELEIFDLGMINYSKYLIKKGMISGPLYYNIILGNISSLQLDPTQIGIAIQSLPANSYWSLGGIGDTQLRANVIAIALNGGVRIGLEDNIYYDMNREIKASNMDLIERIHRIAAEFDRPIMKAKTFGDLGFYNKNRS
ncbi:BKACE family enzyme [Portibacter lacus]|uniref:3-keto-5-aminohexanoate cleavage protein n=1 Tax=Portibacter lacus TaxID=1099794 RepID=UPI001F1AA326|nr:3-keto-5-aminohexanoate cleavage protein [Portibacter lacus]